MSLTTHDIITLLVNEAATVDIYPPERSILHPVLIRRKFTHKASERFTFTNGDIGIMHVYAFKTREVRFTMSRILGMKHWISVDTTGEMSSVEGTGIVSLDRHLAQLNFEEYDVDTSSAVDDTAGANDIESNSVTQQESATRLTEAMGVSEAWQYFMYLMNMKVPYFDAAVIFGLTWFHSGFIRLIAGAVSDMFSKAAKDLRYFYDLYRLNKKLSPAEIQQVIAKAKAVYTQMDPQTKGEITTLSRKLQDMDTSTENSRARAVDMLYDLTKIIAKAKPVGQQEAAPAPVHPNVMAKNMVAAYRAATKTTGPIVDSDFVKVAQSIRSKNIPGAKATLRSVMDTKDEALVSKVLAAATSIAKAKPVTQKEAIQSPNTSGQGKDPNASKNPYDATLTKAGYAYSHSVPVTMGQEKGTHHTYKNDKTGRSIGVWKQGADWKWDGKTSTYSNVSTQGQDAKSLQRHLSWQR